ncbi:MAG: helix-turn-helix transcriptional regulator [Acidobacteria bacterium]|nr:helix-turn-helix transcriptional regulator [Acidobacteriota bacterium]
MAISFDRLRYVEPSPEARRVLWHVLSVGAVSRDEPERHEAHDKPGAFLFWVASGRGTLQFKSGSFSLRPGSRSWLLDLRRPRTYVPAPGSRLITNGLRFAGPGVEAWLDLLGCESEFVFTRREDGASIRRAQRHILELVASRPRAYEWHVHTLVTGILGILLQARGLLMESVKQVPPAVTRVVNAVCADPTRPWRARELAEVARISYSGLRALFKGVQGETLKEFLTRTRLEQARLRLCDPRLAIKDVARELNFSSEYYFSHFFREATGMSPSRFRLMSKPRPA